MPAVYAYFAFINEQDLALGLLHYHRANVVFSFGGIRYESVFAKSVAGYEAHVGIEIFKRVDRSLTNE